MVYMDSPAASAFYSERRLKDYYFGWANRRVVRGEGGSSAPSPEKNELIALNRFFVPGDLKLRFIRINITFPVNNFINFVTWLQQNYYKDMFVYFLQY